MKVDLNLGHSRLIISTCMAYGVLRNQAAYILATAYWETARTMEPVVEAFWLPEEWRRKNLRYYPWHGRGFVQLTWERNYHKASRELNLDLTTDPSVVMRPEVSAEILVKGSLEGWFTKRRLDEFVTLKASNYRGARRVINGTDKATTIAEIARDYEQALLAEGYGVEPVPPVVNDRRDGTQPRKSPVQSTTNIAVVQALGSQVLLMSEQAKALIGEITKTFGVSPEVALIFLTAGALGWIFRERLRKWAEGDR